MTTELQATELDDILNELAMYAMWWGFDKAMETEGKHTTSTRAEEKAKAKQAILAREAHIIKAISHYSSIPVKELEAWVRDYKPLNDKEN